MPRRFNYTNRQKINREDISIRLLQNGPSLSFEADLQLADYKLANPGAVPPEVFVEAYRGASALWKRFPFGRVGALTPPSDRALDEFGVPEGILFRVKVSATDDADLGRLVADADAIRPKLPDEQDSHGQPLIESVPSADIGDELWRLSFDGTMPQLLINIRIPIGWQAFARDPQHRSLFAPAVMRQVLTRVLIIDGDAGEETDPDDWRNRWLQFAQRLVTREWKLYDKADNNLDQVEDWINDAVEAFAARSGLFNAAFAQPGQEAAQ